MAAWEEQVKQPQEYSGFRNDFRDELPYRYFLLSAAEK
jgi:hypothetical protein